jgi:CBS domain-containing protein
MLIKSIMTPDVKFCGPDVSLGAVSRIMAKHGCGIVPVVGGQQKVIGVITDRDVCLAVATRIRYPEELPVGEVMTTKVHTCSPDDDARQALALMKTHAVRRLPVATANGRLAGIVSIDDLVVRTGAGEGAAVPDQEALDALRSICTRTVAAHRKTTST